MKCDQVRGSHINKRGLDVDMRLDAGLGENLMWASEINEKGSNVDMRQGRGVKEHPRASYINKRGLNAAGLRVQTASAEVLVIFLKILFFGVCHVELIQAAEKPGPYLDKGRVVSLRNWVEHFSNSNFLILKYFKHVVLDFWYFKLRILSNQEYWAAAWYRVWVECL